MVPTTDIPGDDIHQATAGVTRLADGTFLLAACAGPDKCDGINFYKSTGTTLDEDPEFVFIDRWNRNDEPPLGLPDTVDNWDDCGPQSMNLVAQDDGTIYLAMFGGEGSDLSCKSGAGYDDHIYGYKLGMDENYDISFEFTNKVDVMPKSYICAEFLLGADAAKELHGLNFLAGSGLWIRPDGRDTIAYLATEHYDTCGANERYIYYNGLKGEGVRAKTRWGVSSNWNQSQLLTIDNSTVTVNEGQTAVNSGNYFVGWSDVTLLASIGSIVPHADTDTWSWSWSTTDGPDDNQEVEITRKGFPFSPDLKTFDLIVNNVPPTVDAGLNQVINEGDILDLDPATFSDPGILDTHTAEIDWGDGTPKEPGTVTQSPGSGPVSGSHVYADNGIYTVEVCVKDDDMAGYIPESCDTFTVTVHNVAPAVVAGLDQEVDEGEIVTLDPATFNDKGTADTHTAIIDWGDGSPVDDGTVTESPFGPPGDTAGADGTVSGSHVYADNGIYTVEVCVKDDDGGESCDTFTVTMHNVPPTVDAGLDQEVDEGEVITLDPATFNDKGTLDTHTATINWGDGSPMDDGTVTESPFGPPGDTAGADGEISGSHVYADNGDYTVEVCVKDDDGGESCNTFTVTVLNVPPTVDAGLDQVIYEGDFIKLDPATFSDPGFDCPDCVPPTAEDFSATIDWGDGLSEPDSGITLDEVPGSAGIETTGTVEASHQYLAGPGVYEVTVCVKDDDMPDYVTERCDSLNVTVVHGFLRFCAYADDDETKIEKESLADCPLVPSGDPDDQRPSGVGSRGKVDIKEKVTIQGVLTSLTDKISVDKESSISGALTAGHDVMVDKGTEIHDSITSGHKVDVMKDALVDGDITAADKVKVDRNATVTGDIFEFASVPPIPDITWVEFLVEAGDENVTVEKGDSLTLPPGVYKDVKVKEQATLILFGQDTYSQYVFKKFEMEKDAILQLDLQNGPIVIDIAEKLTFGDRVQVQIIPVTGDASDILFRVAKGHVELKKEGVYFGTFLARDGDVKLGEGATLKGALYGQKVEVKKEAHIVGMPARDLFAMLFVNP